MNSSSILVLYESIAALTQKMLLAAQNSTWDELVALEKECSQYVSTLKKNDPDAASFTESEKKQQITLIEQILKDNQAIHDIVEPNLSQLSEQIKSNYTEQKLLKTYSA